jgi:hypothetical protein
VIALPPGLVSEPAALPRCCTRHGAPAALTRRITFVSRPPLYAFLALALGLLPGLIVISLLQKRCHAPAWPYCDRCLRDRRRATWRTWAATTVVVAPGIVGPIMSGELQLLGLLIPLGLLALAIGIPLASPGNWLTLAGGRVERRSGWVQFPRAHADFAGALPQPLGHPGS